MSVFYSSSFAKTQKIGEDVAALLNPGLILCLYGNLGAGKTTFVQGLAKGLGIKKRIISPTFTIIRTYEYKLKSSAVNEAVKGIQTLYHVDLYRLRGEQDIEGTGLLEILGDKNALTIIEWPGKMGSLLPKARWDIYFMPKENDKRRITISKIKDQKYATLY